MSIQKMVANNSLCYILTRVDKVTMTNHIVSMKDEKKKLTKHLMH
jgi:hypothetical protein